MSNKPVVVYGASGYTGRLICEYLRELNIPFIAAGRDRTKLEKTMAALPGRETADFEIVEVEHTVEALTKLFTGAKAVCNTVGPFLQYGPTVVEACYNAGVHYSDTTGEQAWYIMCRDEFGKKFAEKNLVLHPGTAQMYTTGEIAANYCLEHPGLDTLDMTVLWKGTPTIASTATIVQVVLEKSYYLEDNKLVEFPKADELYEVVVPGQHELALVHPWGGTGNPIFFKDDPRVISCKMLGGVINRPLMTGVPDMVRAMQKAIEGKPLDEARAILAATAASVNNTDPPRERPSINSSIDSVYASGPLGRAHCLIYGNSNYKQTALLQAWTASQVLYGPPRKVGFASACQAFGHRELHGVLRSYGLSMAPIMTHHGS